MSGAVGRVERVPVHVTVTSPSDLRAAITRAYERVTGQPGSKGVLDALYAQASLETAHGTSMINYNFGGIKGVGPSGLTARAKTPEVIDGKAKTIVDGFRAYRTLDEGAEDYVRLLKGHFSGALSAADAGSMDGFAHELKRAGYYTASEHDYASALRSIAGQKPSTAAPAPSAAPASSGEDFATTAQLMTIFDSMRASSLRILAAGTTEDGST